MAAALEVLAAPLGDKGCDRVELVIGWMGMCSNLCGREGHHL
jgi:hypothetical protein